jgi:hypothetical protein
MLSRLNDAINLQLLRLGEWIDDLSPSGKRIFVATGVALLLLAGYYGLLPTRRPHRYNPHALIHW